MSLILEALRKSEAERRLGQVPGLSTPMPVSRAARRSRPTAVVVVLAILLFALVAVLLWRQTDELDEATPPARSAPVTLSEPQGTATAPSAAAPAPVPTPAREPGPVAAPASVVSRTASVPPVDARAAASAAGSALARSAASAAVPPPPRAPEFDSIERESVLTAPTRLPDAAGPGNGGSGPADSTAPATLERADQAIESVPAPAELAPRDELPSLDQLPATMRDALPPLKLSMHVYTEAIGNRFVLIDGRRYGEGEKLSSGLLLSEIRRDGTVLEFNGTRFLLRRP